jgi:hypothetical protein
MDNKVDPWELLAELREHFGSCGGIPDHLWDITDAALAEHQNAPVEWEEGIDYEGKQWCVTSIDDRVIEVHAGDKTAKWFYWKLFSTLNRCGRARTEAEAKEAAVKAARSLK